MVVIGITELEPKYTLEEFLEEEKNSNYPLEYIDGYIYAKSFTSTKHNSIIMNLVADIVPYLRKKTCKVFSEQIEVIMGKDRVKPDIFIVCIPDNKENFDMKGQSFLTIPSVIFEIVSKSNATLDTITKMELYAKFGVKEYNLVYQEGTIQQYLLLENGIYYLNKSYNINDCYNSIVFEDLKILVSNIFE